jgi:hypothetical protein
LPIDETPEELDVKFLLDLLEDSNTPRFGTARLPSDANMANDPEMGKQVKVLANNPKLFYAEFKRAFEKTIELGACYEAEGKYSLIDISSGKVGGGYGSKGPDSRGQVAVGNNSNSTTTTDSIDNNDSASSKAAPSAATQLSLNLLMNFAFSLTVPLILRIN